MNHISLEVIHRIETDMIKEVDRICRRESIQYYLWYGTALGAVRHDGPIPWDTDADIAIFYRDLDRLLLALDEGLSNKYYVSYAPKNNRSSSMHPEIFANGVDERVVHLDIFPLFGLPADIDVRKQHLQAIENCMEKIYYKRFSPIGTHDMHGVRITGKRIIHYTKCVLRWPFIGKTKQIINTFNSLVEKYDEPDSTYLSTAEMRHTEDAIVSRENIGNSIEHEYDGNLFFIPEQYDMYLRDLYGDYMTPVREKGNIDRALIDPEKFKLYFSDMM